MPTRFLGPLQQAERRICIYCEETLQVSDLPHDETYLICHLHAHAPCAVSELKRDLGIRRSTLSSMLDRLTERGLVRRLPHPDDRRSVLVEPTRTGRALGRRIAQALTGLEQEIERQLTPRDIQGFTAVTAAIRGVTGVALHSTKPSAGRNAHARRAYRSA
jgi:DNA-binding MarR family transcriptional regulator